MKFKIIVTTLSAALLLCACESAYEGAYEVMKADPLPPTSFLPDHQLLIDQNASFPFNRMWYDKDMDWKRITKMKFTAVDVSHMLSENWWDKISEANVAKMKNDVPELAEYTRNSFIRNIRRDTGNHFAVVDNVDEHTAIVQIALVQLVPTKAFFNAVGTTVGFFIPGVSFINVVNSGCVAMECKIIDGKTGKVIAMLTDRAKDESAIIDINGYTWYGHAKEMIDEWAKGFAKISVAKDPTKIKREFPISLISI